MATSRLPAAEPYDDEVDSLFPLEGVSTTGLAEICAMINRRYKDENVAVVCRWALDYMERFKHDQDYPHVLNAILLAERYSSRHTRVETFKQAIADNISTYFQMKVITLDPSTINEFHIWGNRIKRLPAEAAPYEIFQCAAPRLLNLLL